MVYSKQDDRDDLIIFNQIHFLFINITILQFIASSKINTINVISVIHERCSRKKKHTGNASCLCVHLVCVCVCVCLCVCPANSGVGAAACGCPGSGPAPLHAVGASAEPLEARRPQAGTCVWPRAPHATHTNAHLQRSSTTQPMS